MSKFNETYNKVLFQDLNQLPTTDTILPKELCNPDNCYLWIKGQVNVLACLITPENAEAATKALQKCKENSDQIAKPGKYLIYNPNISEQGGQVWMNKLIGYAKADKTNSIFTNIKNIPYQDKNNSLNFEEYIFIPKEKIEDMDFEVDKFIGFQIPEGMTFKIPVGCGRNGSDESIASETQWLAINNGKFDWARSMESMKQSNFKCIKKDSAKLDKLALTAWNKNLK